jgi:hypothetical protein
MAFLGIAYEGVVVEERLPFLKLRLRTGGFTHVPAQKGLRVGDRVKFFYEANHRRIVEVLTIAEWEEEERIRQEEAKHAAEERILRDGSGDEVLSTEDDYELFFARECELDGEGEPGDYDM